MAEIVRTVFKKKIEQITPRVDFQPTTQAEQEAVLGRFANKADYSMFASQNTLSTAVHTLETGEDENGNIIHKMRVTKPLLERIPEGRRLLESQSLIGELNHAAHAVEDQGASWALVRKGILEEKLNNQTAKRIDDYVNRLARPTSDICRWTIGDWQVQDRRELRSALLKGGVILSGSVLLVANSFRVEDPDSVDIAMQFISTSVAAFNFGVAPATTWVQLRNDNTTLSRGEELYLISTGYRYEE